MSNIFSNGTGKKNDGPAGPAVFINFYVPEPPLLIVNTPFVHHAQIQSGRKGLLAIGVPASKKKSKQLYAIPHIIAKNFKDRARIAY